MPRRSAGSAADPTSHQTPIVAERTCVIASLRTRTPLGRVEIRIIGGLPSPARHETPGPKRRLGRCAGVRRRRRDQRAAR